MKCRDTDVRAFYEKQSHQYSDDSGFDIFCPDNVEIFQGTPKLVDLGIQCYSPDKKAYMLFPRSSLWKKQGLMMLNSVGLIDKQYTGTIKAPLGFFNIQLESCIIERGEALFQLVAFDGERIEVELVDELPETERGERGFGSTTETEKTL